MTGPRWGSFPAMRWLAFAVVLLAPSGFALADAPFSERLARVDAQLLARPSDPDLLIARAELLRRAGRLVEAEHTLAVAGDAPGARVERARLAMALGDAEGALAALDGLTTRTAHVLRSELLAANEPERALEALDAAIAARPDPDLHLRRARLAHRLGRSVEALDVLEGGIDALGGAVVLRLERARIAMEAGEEELAFLEATALLRHDAGRPDWLLLQADAMEAMGHDPVPARKAALLSARERLDARPSDLNRFALARALYADGQSASARSLALTLDRSLPGVAELLEETESP